VLAHKNDKQMWLSLVLIALTGIIVFLSSLFLLLMEDLYSNINGVKQLDSEMKCFYALDLILLLGSKKKSVFLWALLVFIKESLFIYNNKNRIIYTYNNSSINID
jgi:hypothetical protein